MYGMKINVQKFGFTVENHQKTSNFKSFFPAAGDTELKKPSEAYKS